MLWLRRLVIGFPFIIAAVLTVLMNTVDRVHLHRVDAYGFLFGLPWAWLLDRGWFGFVQSRWGEIVLSYLVILWLPALLYSLCLWLSLRGFRLSRHRARQRQSPKNHFEC